MVETIHDTEWSWSGWDEGEELSPPEPGKRWLTIYHWGEEFAVIVHRMVDGLDNSALMGEKERNAQFLVDALRNTQA